MKNIGRSLTITFVLVISLLFSGFALTNTIPPQPIQMDLSITALRLTKDVELQYRYINRILKYIVIKNSGTPVEIKVFGQGKVLGTDETFVLTRPKGVFTMQLDMRDYSAQLSSSIFNLSRKLATRTYLLCLPEYSDRQKNLFIVQPHEKFITGA